MTTFAINVTKADNFDVTISADLPPEALSTIRWAVHDLMDSTDSLDLRVGRLAQSMMRAADYHNTADSFTISNQPICSDCTWTVSISESRVCIEDYRNNDDAEYIAFADMYDWVVPTEA
jgi:hypothetical protein